MPSYLNKFWLLGLWALLVFIPLLTRSLLPIDETRYVTVAWEMWLRGEWLIPFLNGEFYHHKPPLLFWLIHLGWAIFGVNEWWPRLIPGIFSLINISLTAYLARQWWPQRTEVIRWVPFILLSTTWWSLFTGMVMFDMMLTCFTLMGMIALVKVWQTARLWWWAIFSLAIGFGALSKGPVILLHLLPVALFASWWQGSPPQWRWYFGVLLSVILGSLIPLAWAIPAAIVGGEEFRQAIFWGQTANRLVNSFAHNHPFWWYLPWLPVILMPWTLWMPFWRGLRPMPRYLTDSGIRFCVTWLVLVLSGFSLISGKQLHYLLPLLSAFALLAAYLLFTARLSFRRYDVLMLGCSVFLLGMGLILAPKFLASPSWLIKIPPWSGFLLILLTSLLIIEKNLVLAGKIVLLSTIAILTNLIVITTVIQAAGKAYDLREISSVIKQLQEKEVIVHFGDYHGQYQFYGRLEQPLQVIDEYNICSWLITHPHGKLVVYLTSKYETLSYHADFVQAYRSNQVGIIDAQWLQNVCWKIIPLP